MIPASSDRQTTRFGVTREQLASGAVRVALHGELDLAHAYTLDEELRRVEQGCPSCIVIDLRELSFVTSCGVSRLVAARRRARRADRRLVLVRGGRAVQRLLTLSAVDQTFELVNDVPRRAGRASRDRRSCAYPERRRSARPPTGQAIRLARTSSRWRSCALRLGASAATTSRATGAW